MKVQIMSGFLDGCQERSLARSPFSWGLQMKESILSGPVGVQL